MLILYELDVPTYVDYVDYPIMLILDELDVLTYVEYVDYADS